MPVNEGVTADGNEALEFVCSCSATQFADEGYVLSHITVLNKFMPWLPWLPRFFVLDQEGVNVSLVSPTTTGQQSFPSHTLFRNYRSEEAASETVVTWSLFFVFQSYITSQHKVLDFR